MSREALLPLVTDETASQRVSAVFADIKATKGIDFVPNFWRALANQPDQLEAIWSQLKTLMHPESVGRESTLDPVAREAIALAVSSTNGCSYCLNSHSAALQKLGATGEAVAEIISIASLFNATNAIADGLQIQPDVSPDFT